jgi:hypothetical protein
VIPNITKGADVGGVLRYLVGPGRANEHVAPHLVAGSDLALAGYGEGVLSAGGAGELARWIDAPRIQHGVRMTVPTTEVDLGTGDRRVTGEREQHVWHASLALPVGDGPVGDARWRQVAEEFAEAMGLTGADGKAPCRWVAVHHGPSKGGNDHVHLVASMAREDGTRWTPYRDYVRAQAACRDLEARHGLTAVDGPARGVRERGVKPVEAARAMKAGAVQTVPQDLAARVRAAALASTSEAEWVRRCRAAGVVIQPRYAKDSREQVVGYKVALPPRAGEKWAFYGGGTLGRDLTLPRLRETWPSPQAEHSAAAVGEWRAVHAGHGGTPGGRETQPVAAGAEAVAGTRWAEYNRGLAGLGDTDRAGWADAARQTSAALGAWAQSHDGPGRADVARAARVLARSAQQPRPGQAPGQGPGAGMAAAVVLLGRGGRPGAELGRELVRSTEAIAAHNSRVGNPGEAARINAALPALRAHLAVAAVGKARTAARRVERIVDHGRDHGR